MKTLLVNALSALQGGGQTYLINLFKQFDSMRAETDMDVRVIALIPWKYAELFDSPGITFLTPRFPSKSIIHRILWEAARLPALIRELHADVLYYPGGTSSVWSVAGCKIAVAFRNMLPFDPGERKRFPLGYMRTRLLLLRFLQARSFKNADLVIFISNYAKSAIDRMVRSRHGRSVVIPHGVPPGFYREGNRLKSPLPYEYVLYVSYVDVYKNQLEVIEAWKYLRESRSSHEKLVLIGPAAGPYLKKVKKAIRDFRLDNEVVYLGKVSYDELPLYYQFAKLNIFASSCENCPNILLEALASGRPVFCSDRMPMPEFGGEAAVYFNPAKPRQLADLLIRHLDDEQTLNELGRAAYKHSLAFDCKNSAQRTWDALLELVH